MKQIPLFFLGLLSTTLIFTACDDSSDDPGPSGPIEAQTATNIPADANAVSGDPSQAPPPNFTLFSLETGEIVNDTDSASNLWDIGLAGTTIIINGGTSGPGEAQAQVINGIFDEVTEAPETGYQADSETGLAIPAGSGNGWYNYTGEGNPPQAIIPIPGRIIVLKTAQGNYAKMEILSYYEGNPDTSSSEFVSFQTRPAGRHYTFNYVVQPNGSRNF